MKLEIDCNHSGRHGHVTGLGPTQFAQIQILASVLVERAAEVNLYERIRLLKFQSVTVGEARAPHEAVFVTITVITDKYGAVEFGWRERETRDFEFNFYPITTPFMQLMGIVGKVDIAIEPAKFGNDTFDTIAGELIRAGKRSGPWRKMYVAHIARKKKKVLKKR